MEINIVLVEDFISSILNVLTIGFNNFWTGSLISGSCLDDSLPVSKCHFTLALNALVGDLLDVSTVLI